MDFTSTKDHYERETEESERLVRPAPKLKPPRHDRRREDMRPGRDPDIDDDPDIAKDKDLSLNHKNIGGSTTQFDLLALRVAGRFVRADLDRSPPAEKSAGGGEDEYVAVVNKETGENTRVKKETLKGPGGAKYKVIKEEGGKKGPSDETVSAVADLAEQNPALKGLLQTLSNPKHKEYATLTAIPQVPLSSLSALKDVQFPEGVKTIGDLHAVAQAAPKKKPEGKPAPGAPAKAPEPKQEAPRAPGPKQEAPEPKTEGAPKEEPKASPPEPREPEEEGEDDYERPGKPSREDAAALKSWLAEGGPSRPDFKAWAGKQKTVSEQDGELLFPKGKERVPFSRLSPTTQANLKEKFEIDVKHGRNADALKGLAKDKNTRRLLRELGNPSSNLRRQLEDTAHKEGGGQLSDLDIKKAIPELKDVDLPDGVLSLQDLVDASERGFAPPPEPERSKPSRQEQLRAQQAIKAVFPPDVAEELGEMDLHPDDISDLVSSFRAAKDRPTGHRDIASLAKTMSAGGYNLDPESVDVPEKDEEGRRFEDLEPDDQAKVYAKHKMSLLATSLAAREKVKQGLKDTGLPDEVAHRLAHEMLSGGERDASDEEVRTFYKQALATAALDDPLSDAQIKKLLKTVGDNPVAKKLAVAYLQAKDYADARETYLDKDPEHPDRQIKEWDNVRTIASKLTDASEFLRERSARYPQDAVVEDPGMAFRNRVIDRLGALTPEAVPFVRSYLEDYEMGAFKDKAKGFDRSFKKFTEAAEKERRALEKERAKAKPGGDVYRQEGEKRSLDEEIEARLRKRGIHRPRRPTPPPGYEFWTDREKVESRGSKSWDWFKKLWKKKNKASSTDHVALRALVPSIRQRVAFRHSISSYPGDRTMGQPSSAVRTAVYWGQEPYEGTAPYPGWTQVHARDLTEKDFNGLVGAAREWLKAPVLGREIKGMVRDTQLRAALDLAIRDHEGGRYSVGLHPTVYNQLLARLSGQDGPYDLLTGKPTDVPRIGSQQARKPMEFTYGRPTGERVQTMKASSHVRMFASRAAAEERDLELAFDMMAFADHLANQEGQGGQGQEGGEQQAPAQTEQQKQAAVRIAAQQLGKFRELRSLIIRTAHAHPEAQAAFWPLLQAIKG